MPLKRYHLGVVFLWTLLFHKSKGLTPEFENVREKDEFELFSNPQLSDGRSAKTASNERKSLRLSGEDFSETGIMAYPYKTVPNDSLEGKMVDSYGQENLEEDSREREHTREPRKRRWEKLSMNEKRGWEGLNFNRKRGWEGLNFNGKRGWEGLNFNGKRSVQMPRSEILPVDGQISERMRRGWEGLNFNGKRGWEGLNFNGKRGWEGLNFNGKRGWEGLNFKGKRGWEGLNFNGKRDVLRKREKEQNQSEDKTRLVKGVDGNMGSYGQILTTDDMDLEHTNLENSMSWNKQLSQLKDKELAFHKLLSDRPTKESFMFESKERETGGDSANKKLGMLNSLEIDNKETWTVQGKMSQDLDGAKRGWEGIVSYMKCGCCNGRHSRWCCRSCSSGTSPVGESERKRDIIQGIICTCCVRSEIPSCCTACKRVQNLARREN